MICIRNSDFSTKLYVYKEESFRTLIVLNLGVKNVLFILLACKLRDYQHLSHLRIALIAATMYLAPEGSRNWFHVNSFYPRSWHFRLDNGRPTDIMLGLLEGKAFVCDLVSCGTSTTNSFVCRLRCLAY
jgi:hypothetical protein